MYAACTRIVSGAAALHISLSRFSTERIRDGVFAVRERALCAAAALAFSSPRPSASMTRERVRGRALPPARPPPATSGGGGGWAFSPWEERGCGCELLDRPHPAAARGTRARRRARFCVEGSAARTSIRCACPRPDVGDASRIAGDGRSARMRAPPSSRESRARRSRRPCRAACRRLAGGASAAAAHRANPLGQRAHNCELLYLNEACVLANIAERYEQKAIYADLARCQVRSTRTRSRDLRRARARLDAGARAARAAAARRGGGGGVPRAAPRADEPGGDRERRVGRGEASAWRR